MPSACRLMLMLIGHAEQRGHLLDQVVRTERLDQVILRTARQHTLRTLILREPGDGQDPRRHRLGRGLDLPTDLKPIYPRHPYVENDQIRPKHSCLKSCFVPIQRNRKLEVGKSPSEDSENGIDDLGLVIHDEDPGASLLWTGGRLGGHVISCQERAEVFLADAVVSAGGLVGPQLAGLDPVEYRHRGHLTSLRDVSCRQYSAGHLASLLFEKSFIYTEYWEEVHAWR